jgi:hypothetical protein
MADGRESAMTRHYEPYRGPSEPVPPGLTIGAFLADKRHRLHAACLSCGHHEPVALWPIARRHGPDILVSDLGRLLRCRECNAQAGQLHYHYFER